MPRRPWEPPVTWLYNTFIMEYNKGGMMKKAGWNEKHGQELNELGQLGWEAVNVVRLNDTQFMILMKYPTPNDLDEADHEEASQYVNNMLEKSNRLFGF